MRGRAFVLAAVTAIGFGGCQDANSPLSPPEPTLTAVSPDSAVYGGGAAVIRVTGRGFHIESVVQFNEENVVTTFLSSGELEATIPNLRLYPQTDGRITVYTPRPGGGTSNALPFRVVNPPAPVLTSFSPESAEYGATDFVLTLTGRHFLPESHVVWNGALVPTTYVSDTELQARIPRDRLLVWGTAEVSVIMKVGSSTRSESLPFLVAPPTPEITVLPSRGATAARPGFTLMVHGEYFIESSDIRWNGELRDATLLAPGRLALTLANADVASPGPVAISVVNVDGKESEPEIFHIRTLGPATADVIRAPIPARDLAWDPGTGQLYASVATGGGIHANTIVGIDPLTGDIERTVYIGSEPNRLARSDDGHYLYVGIDGANGVRRLSLETFTPGLQWSLPEGQVARDIAVVPGQPHAVVVARGWAESLYGPDGLDLYDAGVERSGSTLRHSWVDRIVFLESPDTLFGYNGWTTEFGFHTLAVQDNGMHQLDVVRGLISGGTEIIGASGRIYSANGAVVDAARAVRLGTAGEGVGVAADPETGRLFYLTADGIDVYDMNTFQYLGTIHIPDLGPDFEYTRSPRLLRWGEDGLAFPAQDEIIIVRSPIVAR